MIPVFTMIAERLRTRRDSEHEQALVRIGLAIVVLIYILGAFAGGRIGKEAAMISLAISGAFVVVAASVLAAIIITPGAAPLRRVFGMVLDISATTYVLTILGEAGAVLFAIYLWVIVGNGVRFGRRYLCIAMGLALTGFAYVVNDHVFWQNQPYVVAGIVISLMVIPLYLSVLLQRLDRTNAELKTLYQEMADLATRDSLSGLPNRQLLRDRIEHTLANARRHRRSFAVLFIDVDGFKAINDTWGHGVGDAMICAVARRLRACVRDSDTVAREGGDEFVILLNEIAQPQDAELVAAKILDKVGRPYTIDGLELTLTVSIGIALYPHAGSDADALLVRADAAMYDAKQQGKNGYRLVPAAA